MGKKESILGHAWKVDLRLFSSELGMVGKHKDQEDDNTFIKEVERQESKYRCPNSKKSLEVFLNRKRAYIF